MKSVKRKCSRCGNTGLDEKKRPATRTVAGHSFKASVPALVCDSCGAIYFNGPALENFDLAVANKLARAGVSDGEAVKFIRKAVGLPAVTLAELLDTSPETVSRWERGVSRSMLIWPVPITTPCAHCKRNWALPGKLRSIQFCRHQA